MENGNSYEEILEFLTRDELTMIKTKLILKLSPLLDNFKNKNKNIHRSREHGRIRTWD